MRGEAEVADGRRERGSSDECRVTERAKREVTGSRSAIGGG